MTETPSTDLARASACEEGLATFHFALNEPGFLLLGHAENVVDGANLFRVVDKENRIFARTAVQSALHLAPARDLSPILPPAPELRTRTPSVDVVRLRRTESLLLDEYAPPGVIINERMQSHAHARSARATT